ncbi:MAG: redoxin domain-containing protein [Candidatus Thermoplasmatota archaeon]|nr:redoxin domain-containing protein [Candidatus Thermoplasmatota archaeon]
MTLNIGDKAPNFTALVTDGEDIEEFELENELGDGPVVLGFFPFAFTGTCEEQMCDLRDNLTELEQSGAKTFGLSVDSPFTLKVFHQQHDFGFPLVSDFNREAVEAYGLQYGDLIMGLEGPAKRACLVLDSDGTIIWSWSTDDPGQKPDIREIQGIVAKLN